MVDKLNSILDLEGLRRAVTDAGTTLTNSVDFSHAIENGVVTHAFVKDVAQYMGKVASDAFRQVASQLDPKQQKAVSALLASWVAKATDDILEPVFSHARMQRENLLQETQSVHSTKDLVAQPWPNTFADWIDWGFDSVGRVLSAAMTKLASALPGLGNQGSPKPVEQADAGALNKPLPPLPGSTFTALTPSQEEFLTNARSVAVVSSSHACSELRDEPGDRAMLQMWAFPQQDAIPDPQRPRETVMLRRDAEEGWVRESDGKKVDVNLLDKMNEMRGPMRLYWPKDGAQVDEPSVDHVDHYVHCKTRDKAQRQFHELSTLNACVRVWSADGGLHSEYTLTRDAPGEAWTCRETGEKVRDLGELAPYLSGTVEFQYAAPPPVQREHLFDPSGPLSSSAVPTPRKRVLWKPIQEGGGESVVQHGYTLNEALAAYFQVQAWAFGGLIEREGYAQPEDVNKMLQGIKNKLEKHNTPLQRPERYFASDYTDCTRNKDLLDELTRLRERGERFVIVTVQNMDGDARHLTLRCPGGHDKWIRCDTNEPISDLEKFVKQANPYGRWAQVHYPKPDDKGKQKVVEQPRGSGRSEIDLNSSSPLSEIIKRDPSTPADNKWKRAAWPMKQVDHGIAEAAKAYFGCRLPVSLESMAEYATGSNADHGRGVAALFSRFKEGLSKLGIVVANEEERFFTLGVKEFEKQEELQTELAKVEHQRVIVSVAPEKKGGPWKHYTLERSSDESGSPVWKRCDTFGTGAVADIGAFLHEIGADVRPSQLHFPSAPTRDRSADDEDEDDDDSYSYFDEYLEEASSSNPATWKRSDGPAIKQRDTGLNEALRAYFKMEKWPFETLVAQQSNETQAVAVFKAIKDELQRRHWPLVYPDEFYTPQSMEIRSGKDLAKALSNCLDDRVMVSVQGKDGEKPTYYTLVAEDVTSLHGEQRWMDMYEMSWLNDPGEFVKAVNADGRPMHILSTWGTAANH